MKTYRLLVLVVLNQVLFGQTYNPHIAEIVNSVSLDSLVKHVRILSGEDSVAIADSTYIIFSRASNANYHESVGHRIAAKYLVKSLETYCDEVVEQTFLFRDDTIRNIIGIQEGSVHPEKKLIVSGHYDSRIGGNDQSVAPGADDNASGTATVLEAARILTNYNFDNTILYILWDWEEEGAVGSGYFCTDYGDVSNVTTMLNVDMIGYDILDTGLVSIYGNDSLSYNLALEIANIIDVYSLELTPIVHNSNAGSDSDMFSIYEICPAVGIAEAYFDNWENRNPFYHTIDDRIEHFNLSYYERVAKLAIAACAEVGFTSTSSIDDNSHDNRVEDYLLFQNYPNPFNSTTIIRYGLREDSDIKLQIYNVNGREVMSLVEGFRSAGLYTVRWNGMDNNNKRVSAGMYFAKMQSGENSSVVKMVFLN